MQSQNKIDSMEEQRNDSNKELEETGHKQQYNKQKAQQQLPFIVQKLETTQRNVSLISKEVGVSPDQQMITLDYKLNKVKSPQLQDFKTMSQKNLNKKEAFPIIQSNFKSFKGVKYSQSQKKQTQFGDFYKNIMKPYGGKIVQKLGDLNFQKFMSQTNEQKQNLMMTLNNQSSFNNQSHKLLTNMSLSKLHEVETINQTETDQFNTLIDNQQEPKLKTEQSLIQKNFTYEKPIIVYKDYLKEQKQKSMLSLQETIKSTNLLKEKYTLKNHLKKFKDDSIFIEEINKQIDQEIQSPNIYSKKIKDNQKNQSILLNCFKDIELTFGRKDVETFEQIVKDLLSGQILIEDLLEKEEIDRLMQSKYYAGFSLSNEVKHGIQQTLEDDYELSLEDLEIKLKDKHFCKQINQSYQRHLESYLEDVKQLKKNPQKTPG